jgi:hypothetical protein
MRDKKSEIKKAFDAEYDAITAQQDRVKYELLAYCKAEGINSTGTDAGTVIRSIKTKYWTNDWDEINKFIISNDLPEFYAKSLNQTNIKDWLESHPEDKIPGLNIDSEYVISVRNPTRKK